MEFNVVGVSVSPSEVVYVVGNCAELGRWSYEKAIKMRPSPDTQNNHRFVQYCLRSASIIY